VSPPLDAWNALPEEAAISEMLEHCGSTAWAAAMARARPVTDSRALLVAADLAWDRLEKEDRQEAFAAHSRIGDRAADGKGAREQAGTAHASKETLGALVGLTTVTLAIHLALVETRAWVKRMGFVAVVLVIVQGILGGLRVTEKSIDLAVVHGVTAQVFLSLLVAIAVVCAASWRSDRAPLPSASARTDRRVASFAVAALLIQIVFGAIQRHLALGLMLHVVAAFAVAALTIAAGVRAWGSYPSQPQLRRAGLIVVHATGTQLALGFCAWIARGAWTNGSLSLEWKVVVTTLHQGTGAVLLAATVTLRLLLTRWLTPTS